MNFYDVLPTMTKIENIKTDFELRGEAIADWARREGFKPRNVYAIISGRNRGLRGEAHEIAVRLGLKPDLKREKEERRKNERVQIKTGNT